MADDLTLVVGGRATTGWEDVSVTLRAEGFPNGFEISLSSKEPVTSKATVARAGDACQVKLGDDIVVTGYVDRDINQGSKDGHGLAITGRGRTQDLVDCSAEWPGGQIVGANALEIATKLAKPYGITVRQADGADLGPAVPQFNLNYGETAAEIIQRVARAAGLLAYEDATGALVLARAGTSTAASGLIYGGNVEGWSVQSAMDGRFSDVVCATLSQDVYGDLGEGGFFFDTEPDPNVPRHRLMYLVMEQAERPQEFTIRKAKWEVARRAGRGTIIQATIDSWRDGAGALWAPNTLVPVDLPGLRLADKNLCVSEVTFSRSNEGTHASLTLLPPASFTPEPINLQPVNAADIDQPDAR